MSCQTSMAENAKLRDVTQRFQTQLAGPPFTHHQHGGGAVGERAALAAVTEP